MKENSHENLKALRFEGELLPTWARLLDLATRLCPVGEDSRRWFSSFTNGSGVEDARTVIEMCNHLKATIQENRTTISADLQQNRKDGQSSQIVSAWIYALDTMIQESRNKKTCSWIVEGLDSATGESSDGGDITLRRV
jgi:hypothetical protein